MGSLSGVTGCARWVATERFIASESGISDGKGREARVLIHGFFFFMSLGVAL